VLLVLWRDQESERLRDQESERLTELMGPERNLAALAPMNPSRIVASSTDARSGPPEDCRTISFHGPSREASAFRRPRRTEVRECRRDRASSCRCGPLSQVTPKGRLGSSAGELMTLPGEDPTSMVNLRRERSDGLRAPDKQIARVKWVYPALRQDER